MKTETTTEKAGAGQKQRSNHTMTEAEAAAWVHDHSDDDQLDEQQLEAAFLAIFERAADDEDREQGLWSHLCAAVNLTPA